MKWLQKVFTLICLSSVFCSCSNLFQQKIPMDNSINTGNLKDMFVPQPEITTLDPPDDIKISKGMFCNKISLSWDKVDNARSYKIERATLAPDAKGEYHVYTGEGDNEVFNLKYEPIASFVIDNAYDDIIIPGDPTEQVDACDVYSKECNYRYYYKITPENKIKNYKTSSLSSHDRDAYGYLAKYVKKIEASMDREDSIVVTWNAVEGALSYSVYRSEYDDASGAVYVGNTGAITKYVNKMRDRDQGKDFFYQVIVLNNSGKSIRSPLAKGMVLQHGAPQPPTKVEIGDIGIGNSPNQISFQWDKIEAGGDSKVTYQITRTQSPDYISTTNLGISEENKFVDKYGVKIGIIYRYTIQTIVTTGEESLKSKPSSTYAEGFLLSPPSDVLVEKNSDVKKQTLKFTPAIGYDKLINSQEFVYEIYSSDNKDGPYNNKVSTIEKATVGKDGYISQEVEKKNYYCVKTLNGSASSIESNPVAPQPNAPENVTASKTDKAGIPENLWKANDNQVYPVLITWKKPSDDSPYAYVVKRASTPKGNYDTISEVILAEGKTDFSYVDVNTSAFPRDLYYYKVFSLNVFEAGNNSNEVKNYGVDAGANGINYKDNPACGYGALKHDTWFREYNQFINKHVKLMFNKSDTAKLGTEEPAANIHGTLYYKASLDGLNAIIIMQYRNYCDEYVIKTDALSGDYFVLNGNTNTLANMSSNGNMKGTVQVTGMYPATVEYNKLQVKGGDAGGGEYGVKTYDVTKTNMIDGTPVNWSVSKK